MTYAEPPFALSVPKDRKSSSGPFSARSRQRRGELPGAVERVGHGPEGDRVVERVEPELEGRDDPEVRTGAAQAPEELWVLVRRGAHEAAVRGDEVDGEQVVEGQPERAHQPAHAATEREARDPCVRHDSHGTDEPVLLRGRVQLGEQRAPADAGGLRLRVDLDAAHPGEVDHDPVVAGGEPGDAVPAAADRDRKILFAAEAEGGDDIVHAARTDDHRRSTVDHPVPDAARLVVP